MNYSTAIFLVDETVRAISGVYEDGGKSAVFKTRDPSVKIDDIVVVPSGTRHGFTTFKVKDVDVLVNYDQADPMKWIVGRVDMGEYESSLKHEEEVSRVVQSAEQRKRREDLKVAISLDQSEIAKLMVLKPTP